MEFSRYLKDKLLYIILQGVVVLLTVAVFLVIKVNISGIFFLECLIIMPMIVMIFVEYFTRNRFYSQAVGFLEKLDKKNLIMELINEPCFEEGRILYYMLKDITKYANNEVIKYNISLKEYREYIEMWIHEVKTPIASSKLIIENHENDVTSSIKDDINQIEKYIEQVLFYARSSSLQKDYIIRKIELKNIVYAVMRKNAKDFIHGKIKNVITDLDITVYTDEKWVEFIVNQLITNAIKYRKDVDSLIQIKGVKNANNVYLYIEDNGIGIDDKDIGKVFDKGFTGENGRKYGSSTGFGLYLSKKLCDKMGLKLSIDSKKGEYTRLCICFPSSSYYDSL